MERTELVRTVSERTDAGERAAEEAIDAVLSTLGERLSEDQARDLAAQLPGGAADRLTSGDSGRRFPEAEFVSRVDQRIEGDLPGEAASRAVVATVLEAVNAEQRAGVVDQFEHYGYEDLLADVEVDIELGEGSPREQ